MASSATRAIGLAILASLAVCSAASAEPGVVVDPNSPSGKEYAIPFQADRRIGAPPSDPRAALTANGASAAFGTGITRPSRTPLSGTATSRRAEHRAATSGSAVLAAATQAAAGVPSYRSDGTAGDSTPIVLGIVIAVGGSMLGAALPLLRQRSKPAPPAD